MSMELVQLGFLASLLAGAATGLGAIPIFFLRNLSQRTLDVMLGFAAGVMIAATAFSLLIPAIELSNVWIVAGGFLAGAIFVHLLDRYVPHEHIIRGFEGHPAKLSKVTLLILAITIHNFPEGLAVGVTFGTGDIAAGMVIAIAIGLQNIPEGSAVAFPLIREGISRERALWYATLSGLVEPIGGLIGVLVVSLMHSLLPVGLTFAAGAMTFVVSDEMKPESHRMGHEREATFGFIIGFTVMMFLDTIFG